MMSQTGSILNELIQTLKDGELGYTAAAEDAERSDLKAQFREYAMQRSEFAAALQKQVEDRGEAAEDSGSFAGDLHRGWLELKSAVVDREDLAILEECERGENSAVQTYTEALREDLGTARPRVQEQFLQIQAALEQVQKLKESLRPPDDTTTGATVLV